MAVVKKLISLDENLAKELELVAKSLNTSQKEIIEKALDFYFDYTDALIADQIIDDIENKKMKTYSEDEAKELLGLK